MIETIEEDSHQEIVQARITRRTRYSNLRQQPPQKSPPASMEMLPSARPVSQAKECRVCWDGHDTEEDPLRSPCSCTGSLRYIHDKCYRQWLERQYTTRSNKERVELINSGVECEVCKTRVFLRFEEQCRCCNKDRISNICKNQCKLMTLFIVFMLLNGGCLGFLIYHVV